MSHTVDIEDSHITCRVVAFLLRSPWSGPERTWVPSLVHSPIKYGSVGGEKEPGNEILSDLDARPSDA
jgi:hypothetical protein